MYKINIITFSMSFLLSLGSKDINAQNSKDENLRFMSNKYYNLYESYMIGVLFDSAAATLIKSIEFSSKIQNKLSLDSMILLASYQKLCVINEYLGKYDEILKYFDKAFLYLDKRISPEDPTQFSELMLLKQIMVVQILCIKDIESDQFNNNFNRFTELVNLNRKNSKKYSNGKKYLDLFTKIKSGDKSENLYNILKCESLELQSHVFTDYQTLYRILKDLVETYDKVLLTCENNEKIIFQTYLHAHAGHLSYVALFNKNFILAEKMAIKAFKLFQLQKWVMTNLIHSLYLQGRYDECKLYYLRYRDIEIEDGRSIKQLIINDIEELKSKGVCKDEYQKFIVKTDKDNVKLFNSNSPLIYPTVPVICDSKKGVKVTSLKNKDQYEWVHLETKKKIQGKSVHLKKTGKWILKTQNHREDVIKYEVDTFYVDEYQNLHFLLKYFKDMGYLELPFYRNIITNSECFQDEERYKFVKESSDYVRMDSVANSIFDNFLPFEGMRFDLQIIKNTCLCDINLDEKLKLFSATENGLFLFTYFDNNSNEGKLFIRARMIGEKEDLPIFNQNPKYNHTLRLYEIFPEILTYNKSTFEQFRSVFTNVLMAHPIGGYR